MAVFIKKMKYNRPSKKQLTNISYKEAVVIHVTQAEVNDQNEIIDKPIPLSDTEWY
jgi:hypothetical protein